MGHCHHKFQERIRKRSKSYPLCWLGEWRPDSYWKELHPSAHPLETRPLQSDPLMNIKPNQKHKFNSVSLPYLARNQISHLPMMVLLTVPTSLSKSSSIKSTNSFSTYKNTWTKNIVQLEEDFHIDQQRTVPLTAVLLTCMAWVLSTSGCPAMTTVSPSVSPSIRSTSVAWPRSRFSAGSASPVHNIRCKTQHSVRTL